MRELNMKFLFAPFKRKLTFVVMINNTRKEEEEEEEKKERKRVTFILILGWGVGRRRGGSEIHGHACQPDHLISFLELIA